jgi:hypothetical protein
MGFQGKGSNKKMSGTILPIRTVGRLSVLLVDATRMGIRFFDNAMIAPNQE